MKGWEESQTVDQRQGLPGFPWPMMYAILWPVDTVLPEKGRHVIHLKVKPLEGVGRRG